MLVFTSAIVTLLDAFSKTPSHVNPDFMSWDSILNYLLAPKTKLFQRLRQIPQLIDEDKVLPAHLYKLKVTLIEVSFEPKQHSNKTSLLLKDLIECVVHYYEAKRGMLDKRRRNPEENSQSNQNKSEFIENALEIESAPLFSPASSKGDTSETRDSAKKDTPSKNDQEDQVEIVDSETNQEIQSARVNSELEMRRPGSFVNSFSLKQTLRNLNMLDHEETRPLNKAPEAQSRLHKLRAKYSSNTKGAQQQPPSARRGNDMSSSKSTSNLTSSMVTPSNETSALSNKNPSFVQPAERISKRRPSQQAMTTLSKPKTATKANARTPAKGVNSSAYSTGTYPYFMKSSPASENPLSSAHSQKSSENMSTSCSVKDKPANYASVTPSIGDEVPIVQAPISLKREPKPSLKKTSGIRTPLRLHRSGAVSATPAQKAQNMD